jgi:hypothetical protein
MNLKVKRTKFLSTIVLAILTWLALTACKPETGSSPLATPETMNAQSRDGSRPRTVPPPGTPNPTPTPLPDHGVRVGEVTEMSLVAEKNWKHFAALALDGQTAIGSIDDGTGRRLPIVIDLETKQTQVLDQNPNQVWIHDLYLSKPYAVWVASQDKQNTLYARDIQAGQTLSITDDAHNINFSGTTVVWNQVGESWDIWGYDLAQQKRFPVVTGPGAQFGPLVSKRWVAFLNLPPGDERTGFEAPLDVVNIDSSQVITVGSLWWNIYAYPLSLYAIDAPWVAWSSWGSQSSSPDLYLYNLDTRTAYTVTVPSCVEFQPNTPPSLGRPGYLTMSNRVVIFSGCYQDMGYDIERQVFFSLPTEAPYGFNKLGWSIAGDQLVWILSSGPYGQEESHIYTAKIIRDK